MKIKPLKFRNGGCRALGVCYGVQHIGANWVWSAINDAGFGPATQGVERTRLKAEQACFADWKKRLDPYIRP
jgi:hypothetical protein